MHLKDFIKVFTLLVLLIIVSCRKDQILTDSSAKLKFSEDTILFDTVFASVGSTTQYLLVYNNNDQPVNISNIQLGKGAQSYYRINVNGKPGTYFNNIEIRAKDSLWIFIEVTIDPTNNTTPFLVTDSILFNLNGNMQHVNLVAFGQDAHFIIPNKSFGGLPYSLIDTNNCATITWDSIKPYVVYGYAVVDSCQTLNILPGTKIYFYNNGGLWIYHDGNLHVNGTKEHPVTFQGTRLEQSYAETPGQWDRIWINEGGTSTIDYAIIKNSFIGLQTEYLYGDNDNFIEGTHLTVTNTIIENMSGIGIYSKYFNADYKNCVIANCGVSCVQLFGGTDNFTHCTIANYWRYGQRSAPSVLLADYYTHTKLSTGQTFQYIHISLHANFYNSIIYGNTDMEINTDLGDSPNDFLFHSFNHCLIKVDAAKIDITNTNHFVSVINNQDPLFEEYLKNNYHLQSGSPAINAGDINFGLQVPNDIEGNSRTASPDLGAYERQ